MTPPVQPGQVIRNKYRIERVLGEGGMGVVVAAQHVGLGTRVAIKFLHVSLLRHKDVVERFAREARAASRLESDHVARVTDVDAMEDGTPFMVMEYLEGHDLSSVRTSGQPIPVHLAAGYLLQACEAIGEAHELGIVHRDIKPANLFLARRAGGKTRVKVLDFGISKMGVGGAEAGLTRTSTVVGSAHYMSPEQMLATRDVDGRADIWALGATLYELVTARVPFPGESVTQVCAMVMSSPPVPPSQHLQGLPAALDQVVLGCLERDLGRRIATVADLVAALGPLATAPTFGVAATVQGLGVPAVPGSPGAPPPSALQVPGPSAAGLTGNTGPRAIHPADGVLPLPGDASTVMLPGGPSPGRVASPSNPAHPAPLPGATWSVSAGSAPVGPGASGDHPLASASSPRLAGPFITNAAVSRTGSSAAAGRSTVPVVLGGIGAALMIVLGATAFVLSRGEAPAPVPAALPSRAEVSAPPHAPSAVADAMPSNAPAVRPVEASTAPSSTATAAPSTARVAVAPPGPTAPRTGAPRQTSAPVAPRKPAVSCNPPFTIDAQGVKRAKPECL